jgi:hypothetical protein
MVKLTLVDVRRKLSALVQCLTGNEEEIIGELLFEI